MRSVTVSPCFRLKASIMRRISGSGGALSLNTPETLATTKS